MIGNPATIIPLNYAIEGGALLGARIGFTYAASKLVYKSIDFISIIFNITTESWFNLSCHLKSLTEMVENITIFSTVNEFISPNKEGCYLLTNPKIGWQKVAERVSFCAHTFFKFINGCLDWGLIELGKLIRYSIGQLSVFKFVTDGLFAVSSFFVVWGSKLELKEISKTIAFSKVMIRAWEGFGTQDKEVSARHIKSWKKVEEECRINRNAIRLRIFTSCTKVILVPLAMIFTALSLETTAHVLCLIGLGLLGDSVGLIRMFYEEFALR